MVCWKEGVQSVCILGTDSISAVGCQCDAKAHVTNDHCCLTGQEYINGKCQTGCAENKCVAYVDGGYECKDMITDVFTRKSETDSSCACTDEDKCYDLSNPAEKRCVAAGAQTSVNDESKFVTKGVHGECVYSDENPGAGSSEQLITHSGGTND